MGDSLRDELEKQRKRSTARPHGDREAAEQRRKAIKRQQSRAALRDSAKEEATQRRLV